MRFMMEPMDSKPDGETSVMGAEDDDGEAEEPDGEAAGTGAELSVAALMRRWAWVGKRA